MKITYKFYLREPENTDAKAPIYMQITADRKTTKRAIGYELFAKEWDSEKERAKLNHTVNQRIQQLQSKLNDLQYDMQKNPQELSVSEIADHLFKEKKCLTDLLDFFKNRMETENDRGVLSNGTYKHYKSCHNNMEAFIFNQYKKKDVALDKVDLKFIEAFDSFLVKRELSRNTINSNYHKKLKTTLSNALKQDLIDKNPYENFKLKQVSTMRNYLTEEELLDLQKFNFKSNPSLDKVRDLFVFSCYTGLRFSDAQDLKIKDVQFSDGMSFIYRMQNKTSEVVHIPLNHIAIEILKKYDNDDRVITGKLLPQISNQKLNAYIKTVGDLVGINKVLTHHIARHTCATLLLNKGVSMSIVQKILGHENIRTTQQYAKVLNKTISDQVLNAFNQVNNGK